MREAREEIYELSSLLDRSRTLVNDGLEEGQELDVEVVDRPIIFTGLEFQNGKFS